MNADRPMPSPKPIQSLAEFLNVPDSNQSEPFRPVEQPVCLKMSARDFCRHILSSIEYRMSVLNRITLGTLPPAVECLIHYYAHGKPVERVEVKDTSDPLDDFNAEQLEERALRLLEVARQLRTNESSNNTDSTSVH